MNNTSQKTSSYLQQKKGTTNHGAPQIKKNKYKTLRTHGLKYSQTQASTKIKSHSRVRKKRTCKKN